MVFMAIWWAWMGLTWFATTYDNDDPLYRTKVFVQMVGVLVLAAGVPRAFEHGDFSIITLGYCIMRVGLVSLWLRAARSDPPGRRTALRYAGGIATLQLGWIGLLFVPTSVWFAGWAMLIALELLIPAWDTLARPTNWHRHHIAERYGLLTIIVLGESILAATLATQSAIGDGAVSFALLRAIGGGLLILFSMWWIYFADSARHLLTSVRVAFQWGYGHLFVFASAAAVGSGFAVYTDFVTHHAHISGPAAAATIAIPVSVFLVTVWLLHVRPGEGNSGDSTGGHATLVDPSWASAISATTSSASSPGSFPPGADRSTARSQRSGPRRPRRSTPLRGDRRGSSLHRRGFGRGALSRRRLRARPVRLAVARTGASFAD
jgi:low temperature requirement protein LtrA